MIYYFTPYSLDKNLGAAYNHYMELLPNDDDWACFTDGDTMFLSSDFGHIINEVVEKFPDTGMFTCYTNRVSNKFQRYGGGFSEVADIRHHRNIAIVCERTGRGKILELNGMISGMMMIIQKKTWYDFPFKDGLLSVDNDISKRLLIAGEKILLIKGIYLLHYYRLAEGRGYKKHLQIPQPEIK